MSSFHSVNFQGINSQAPEKTRGVSRRWARWGTPWEWWAIRSSPCFLWPTRFCGGELPPVSETWDKMRKSWAKHVTIFGKSRKQQRKITMSKSQKIPLLMWPEPCLIPGELLGSLGVSHGETSLARGTWPSWLAAREIMQLSSWNGRIAHSWIILQVDIFPHDNVNPGLINL